jgi:hypothetical protein
MWHVACGMQRNSIWWVRQECNGAPQTLLLSGRAATEQLAGGACHLHRTYSFCVA